MTDTSKTKENPIQNSSLKNAILNKKNEENLKILNDEYNNVNILYNDIIGKASKSLYIKGVYISLV